MSNVSVHKQFPEHWGAPPRVQTRDLRPLPGGYGRGSSVLAGAFTLALDPPITPANRLDQAQHGRRHLR